MEMLCQALEKRKKPMSNAKGFTSTDSDRTTTEGLEGATAGIFCSAALALTSFMCIFSATSFNWLVPAVQMKETSHQVSTVNHYTIRVAMTQYHK